MSVMALMVLIILIAFVATIWIRRQQENLKNLGHYNGKNIKYISTVIYVQKSC